MHELAESFVDLCIRFPETAHCTLTFLLAMVFTDKQFLRELHGHDPAVAAAGLEKGLAGGHV